MNIPINPKKIKKREIVLMAVGLLLLIVIVWFVSFSLHFLIIKIEVALENGTFNEDKLPKINFDGLKKIGIIK